MSSMRLIGTKYSPDTLHIIAKDVTISQLYNRTLFLGYMGKRGFVHLIAPKGNNKKKTSIRDMKKITYVAYL